MENKYLFQYEEEASAPLLGVLVADHFHRSYGFQGHRDKGTQDWLMIYTVSGEGSVRVDREVHTCREGDVAVLAPGIPHHYAANKEKDWDLLWVHFVPLPEQIPYLQMPRTAEGLICVRFDGEAARQRTESAFRRLVLDARHREKAYQDLAMLALTEILILLHQAGAKLEQTRQFDERIESTVKYLSETLQRKHRLEELAGRVNLSVSRFGHLMKEQTGESVVEVLQKMRLHRAAKLLKFTTRPIQEVASEVGFESAYYFTRRFTGQFGVNPTSYRRQVQEDGVEEADEAGLR